MKKLLNVSFLLIVAALISACGGDSNNKKETTTTTKTTSTDVSSDTDKALISLGASVTIGTTGSLNKDLLIDGKTSSVVKFTTVAEYVIHLGGVKKISKLEILGESFYTSSYNSSDPSMRVFISSDGSTYTETMRPFGGDCSASTMKPDKRVCDYSTRKSVSHIKIAIKKVDSSGAKGLSEVRAYGTD